MTSFTLPKFWCIESVFYILYEDAPYSVIQNKPHLLKYKLVDYKGDVPVFSESNKWNIITLREFLSGHGITINLQHETQFEKFYDQHIS
jgi:hypothetical protein